MQDDNLGDWRIALVTTLTADVPAAYPGGPSHKKGAGVYLTTGSNDPAHGKISFITPHPSALAFSIAFEYARSAKKLQSRLARVNVVAPDGPVQAIPMANIPSLYDYFEQAMIVVTFSFQAIEAFLNNEISHTAQKEIRVKRKEKWQVLTPQEAERVLSTEEKAANVLPELLAISTPKGKKPWEGFKKLKDARDATIHIKNKDTYQISASDNLFLNFLTEDLESYPMAALNLVNWFYTNRDSPRWLKLLSERESIKP
ncbi:hypothetical protein [Ectopseudomonas mendocina]|uniref:hypothetical protein n=1 Tax=Ectopseudomonas mendocina TaxID=300 RepID=UPI0005A08259|nr:MULTISPECIES: hypothetical protein [Pseudomonas]TRO37586.1 hypothetical protein EQ832_12420 [Pseudomonas sp. ALS1131]